MIDRRALLTALPAVLIAGPALAQTRRAAPAPALLTAEDRALVAEASAYLQALAQVKGRFVQTSPRGSVTRGEVFIKRPGKARFAYDPPSGLLVVSDGHNVSMWDQRLKTFDRYPLGSTPLSLFLAKHIRLDQGVMVRGIQRQPGGFSITLRDGRRQAEGQVVLTFSQSPLALREWALTDAQGQTTRVALSALEPAALDNGLFVLRDPRPRRTTTPK